MSLHDPCGYLAAWFGEDVSACFRPVQNYGVDPGWPNPLNTPGPMYVTTNSFVSLAGMQQDGGHLLGTEGQHEYYWRQPRDAAELTLALEAAAQDEVGSHGWDGLGLWTPLAVGLWWAGRTRLVAHLTRVLEQTQPEPEPWRTGGVSHDVLRRHLAYMDGGMELDLRRLAYFLEHERLPPAGAPLPLL